MSRRLARKIPLTGLSPSSAWQSMTSSIKLAKMPWVAMWAFRWRWAGIVRHCRVPLIPVVTCLDSIQICSTPSKTGGWISTSPPTATSTNLVWLIPPLKSRKALAITECSFCILRWRTECWKTISIEIQRGHRSFLSFSAWYPGMPMPVLEGILS